MDLHQDTQVSNQDLSYSLSVLGRRDNHKPLPKMLLRNPGAHLICNTHTHIHILGKDELKLIEWVSYIKAMVRTVCMTTFIEVSHME